MFTVSLAMIVRDEDRDFTQNIAGLNAFTDEIVIAGVGPAEDALRRAGALTDKLFRWNGPSDASDARNFLFSKTAMDTVFWLDAHESVTPPNLRKLLALKRRPMDADAYYMLASGGYSPRLVRRDSHFLWFEPVHEYLLVWGNKRITDISIRGHQAEAETSERDIAAFQAALDEWDTLSPRAAYYYSRALGAAGRLAEARYYHRLFLETLPVSRPHRVLYGQ